MAWSGKADQGIHIGAVDVNLATVLVNDVANFANAFFENAVSRGVRHHQCGELVAVLLGFLPQIRDINIAQFVAVDDHHTHTCHRC